VIRFALGFTNHFNPMKTIHFTLLACGILSCAFTATAQTINCDSFTVIGIEPDTFDVNNTLIQIEMGGGDTDFANYPYIPSITDCNGDTVATGGMFFFGQIGGTVSGYPVSAISDDVCLPLTIQFVYSDNFFVADTCLLTFGSTNLSSTFDTFNQLHVYPNPTQGDVQIESSQALSYAPFIVSNQMGTIVLRGMLNSANTRIDMRGLGSGVYTLRVGNEVVKVVRE
jgi:hypothetical protein